MISIIIVNYHQERLLRDCLDSLVTQNTHLEYEIIVIDNDSSHEALNNIENDFKHIKLVKLTTNTGFTGGNIKGLKYALGDYVVLLNNDTEVEKDWLNNLIKPFEDDSEIGICASKILVFGTTKIDSAGDGCTNTGRGFKIGEGQDSSLYNENRYVFGACGGAVAYRRQMLDEIGFFDQDFFLIYEDTDLSFRAQLMGWKCVFVHNAVVYHKVRSTIGDMSDIAVYYSVRNAEYVWLKNMPFILMIKYLPHKLIQEIGNLLYFCVKNRKYRPYCKAKIDFLRNIINLLRKRLVIQREMKVSNKYIDNMLTNVLSKNMFVSKLRKLISYNKNDG